MPANGEADVNTGVLKWSGPADCTYDVYFGTSASPSLFKKAFSATEIKPVIIELNSKYFWRVVAKKGDKTLDSSALFSFSTLPIQLNPKIKYSPLTDTRDNKIYWTTSINGSEWLAHNLDFKIDEKSYYFENSEANKVYGLLYTGMLFTESSVNVCPEGWHLPSMQEWLDLLNSTGGIKTSAPALREATAKYWRSSTVTGNNESGMSVLPSGSRDSKPSFSNLGKYTTFWTSTPNEEIEGSFYTFNLGFMRANVINDTGNKNWSYSIRCIKDK